MIRIIEILPHAWSNVFSEHPVLELRIEGLAAAVLPDEREVRIALDKLVETFIALGSTRLTGDDGGWHGFLENLQSDQKIDPGDLIGGIAVGLQLFDDDRVPRKFGARLVEGEGRECLFIAYHFVQPGCAAVLAAVELVNFMMREPTRCAQAAQRMLNHFSVPGSLGGLEPLSKRVIEAAEDRRIPWRVIDPATGTICLGHGRKQIRYGQGLSDADSALGYSIASNRGETLRILQQKQIRSSTVKKVDSIEAAELAADEMGYPVIINPVERYSQRQDFYFLNHADKVRARAAFLLGKGGELVVQGAGSSRTKIYRLVVIDDRFIIAFSPGEKKLMEPIKGIHPDNRRLAEKVAGLIGLKTAEVTLLARDIGESWTKGDARVLDVEAGFASRNHWPEDQRGTVARAIVDFLFPAGQNGRIPIAAITGTNGKTTTCRMLDHILLTSGKLSAVATTEGVLVAGKLNGLGDAAACQGSLAVLEDPAVEFAVLETARGGLLEEGLAFDECEVAAVLNVTADHLGIDGIDTLDQMAEVKARVACSAQALVVLNADDPLTVAMAGGCQAERIAFVSLQGRTDFIDKHIKEGGIALLAEGEDGAGKKLHLYDGEKSVVIAEAGEIPATMGGLAHHNIFNTLVASGLAYGLGISLKEIVEGVKTFHNNFASNPGRLNVFEGCPFTVVIDYAHNPEGIEVACDTLERMEVKGRRLLVLATTGNRHGDHIERTARFVAGRFDRYLCARDNTYSQKDDGGTRGFPATEIPGRLADSLRKQGVEAEKIEVADEFHAAFTRACELCSEGDLLLVFTDEYQWCHDQLHGLCGKEAKSHS